MKKRQLIYFERLTGAVEGPMFVRIGRQRAVWLLSQGKQGNRGLYPLVLDCSHEIPRLVPHYKETAEKDTWGRVFRHGSFTRREAKIRPLGLPNFWLDELGNMIGPDGEIVLKVEEET